VLVEVRDSAGGAYGLGRKLPMKFGEFVARVAAGDAGLYLTAQQVGAGGFREVFLHGDYCVSTPCLCAVAITARTSIDAVVRTRSTAPPCKRCLTLPLASPSKRDQVPVAPDGHAELSAPPVTQLLPLLPLQPGPLPHLVPQSVNMWMGAAPDGGWYLYRSLTHVHRATASPTACLGSQPNHQQPAAPATSFHQTVQHTQPPRHRPTMQSITKFNNLLINPPPGSSTGLHHDFHDNLYALLRGKKRFRLFPPSAAGRMYARGEVARAHGNGRIVYRGQGDVAADGSGAFVLGGEGWGVLGMEVDTGGGMRVACRQARARVWHISAQI
jgi:hypothetical protein